MRLWPFILPTLLTLGVFSSMALGKEKKEMQRERAVFAGGCFWCLEPPFEKEEGVLSVVPGYVGGSSETAHYKLVAAGKTRHVEAVEILYDKKKISYKKLVDIFLRQIDPTQEDGQFADRGPQYQTGVYYLNEEQKKIAQKALADLARSKRFKKKIVVKLLRATPFFKAEEYHQDYYKKNPYNYKFYRTHSGRDAFLKKYWK